MVNASEFLQALSAGGAVGHGEHRSVQPGQDLVMQRATQTLIEHLSFGESALLDGDEAIGQLRLDQRFKQPLATGAGHLDVFLGVEAAICFGP